MEINSQHSDNAVHAFAILDCASKLTLLKLSSSFQLKLDLNLNDSIQLNQALKDITIGIANQLDDAMNYPF